MTILWFALANLVAIWAIMVFKVNPVLESLEGTQANPAFKKLEAEKQKLVEKLAETAEEISKAKLNLKHTNQEAQSYLHACVSLENKVHHWQKVAQQVASERDYWQQIANQRQNYYGKPRQPKAEPKKPKTLYQVLGLRTNCTQAQIKNNYKHMSMMFHPDKSGYDSSKRMQQINRAYEILSDPAKRAKYDRQIGV